MTTQNKIDDLMKQQGRSVQWMMERLEGVADYNKLHRWRKNEQQPDIHEACLLAEIFEVQMIQLIKPL